MAIYWREQIKNNQKRKKKKKEKKKIYSDYEINFTVSVQKTILFLLC
jgi:hypothetical protein